MLPTEGTYTYVARSSGTIWVTDPSPTRYYATPNELSGELFITEFL